MWHYALCAAGIAALISLCSPLLSLTETTARLIDYACLLLIPVTAIGFTATTILARGKPLDTSDADQAEFVGNIPMAWNIQMTAEVATARPRPKLPPQSIFFPHARSGANRALNSRQLSEQGGQWREVQALAVD